MTVKEYKIYYSSAEFKRDYLYDGNDLGASCIGGAVCFKVWSPLADKVVLYLYADGEGPAYGVCPMRRKGKGVWEITLAGCGHGTYYDFELTFGNKTVRSADPWARACSCNGSRSMAVDLRKTDPPGWDKDKRPEETPEQIVYEMHVKDFSYDKASGVPRKYRGKYKAFTLGNTTLGGAGRRPTCLAYLKELGVTHVQLMPVYDFGSVDEGGKDTEYNWGYDPKNFNVPEGSYSTDPYRGEVRIRELKELVMALHKEGIGVIMDVVYNHTHSLDSFFSRTVPHYFYRQFEDGRYSDGSACGNDFACEREMGRKYIIESVLYWAKEYHMDGFRFDLMGLMDVELLNEIRTALDTRYGKGKILLYGEPWSAGASPMEEGFHPCKKENVGLLSENVGVFCDNTRDTIKGNVFYDDIPGFVNGGDALENKMLKAVGAWVGNGPDFPVKAPSQVVTYVSAHDNMTLWDKLMVTMRPGKEFAARDEAVVRAYKMAAAVCFTCQGRIFFLGGEEGARTKYGDENSYCSSPQINKIDWKRIYEYEDILEYYKGLVGFRKQMSGLTDKTPFASGRITDREIPKPGVVCFRIQNEPSPRWNYLEICYNSTCEVYDMELPEGKWELLVDAASSRWWEEPKRAARGQKIAPVSVSVFGKRGA